MDFLAYGEGDLKTVYCDEVFAVRVCNATLLRKQPKYYYQKHKQSKLNKALNLNVTGLGRPFNSVGYRSEN